MVTSSDGSTPTLINYKWNTTGCFTNSKHTIPTCFPNDKNTKSVTGYNLLAEDAGTITCAVNIENKNHTSKPLTLRISGNVHVIIK